MQLEIRALTAADAAEFHALRLRGLQESPEAFGSTATIWGMYVAPEARGGVARGLLADVIAEVRTWPDVVRITLSVVDRAAAARELYRSAGFQSFGREPDAVRQNGVRDTVEHLVLRLDTHRT